MLMNYISTNSILQNKKAVIYSVYFLCDASCTTVVFRPMLIAPKETLLFPLVFTTFVYYLRICTYSYVNIV